VGRGVRATGMNDQRQQQEAVRTRAEVRRGWWPGWIWSIPIAALLLIGWWGARTLLSGGENITISFADAHGIKAKDTKVEFRGMKIGQVSDLGLAKDGSGVDVTVHIEQSAAKFLTSGTRFWLRGAHPSFEHLSSLAAVLSGPTLVMAPGPGSKTKHFVGLDHEPVISGAHGPPQIYRISLAGGDVGKLKRGDPVKLRGFVVGEVRDIGFRYDANSGAISTPVTVALYPSLFHIAGAGQPDSVAALTPAIDRLIGEGLRATVKRDPPLIGSPEVTLEMVPGGTGKAPALADGVPQIPAESASGLSSIVDRFNKVPVDEIAHNVLDITHRVDSLVASDKLKDAIAQLDAALTQIHQTTSRAGPKVTELVDRLRKTAAQIDRAAGAAQQTAQSARQAAKSADNMLSGTTNQNGMQKAMQEITEAARSVRELANYLDRHPEALLQGRGGG
jgi:paraquat-inducible protein B